MKGLDGMIVRSALEALGAEVAARGQRRPITICLVGGAAGLLGGWLRAGRVTADCDVMELAPEASWGMLEDAAGVVGVRLGLPGAWLNRECQVHAWCAPLGWEGRCGLVGRFGPLEVRSMARVALIASKVVSAPLRPQDLEDLRHLKPQCEELDAAELHLDRLRRESLAGESFEDQWRIIRYLRGGT